MIFLTSSVVGQNKYGIRGALNISRIVGDQTESYVYRPGVTIGTFLTIDLPSGLSVQPELNYSTYNSAFPTRIGSVFNSSEVELIQRYSYLEIPLMLQIEIYKGLKLESGFQIGFLSQASLVPVQSGVGGTNIFNLSAKTNFATQVGFQYLFESGLQLGFRGMAGLNNINDEENLREATNDNLSLVARQRIVNFHFYIAKSFN